ncbi:MAG: hypothetical protein IPK82_17170 [Polyangiaceae bacterium]|nr:hypothetical protein [Polyangiaceae bacterium]
MTIQLLEVPVVTVSVDESRWPDRDETLIFEHLLRYCSKFDPLPAITIAFEDSSAVIVRGHKYLFAAKALGRGVIRAVVTGNPRKLELEKFLAHCGAKILDWDAIKQAEERQPVITGWHVFFFAQPLSSDEKAAFDAVVASSFVNEGVRVTHDDAGPFAEFQAATPATDSLWMASYFNALMAFSRERAAIVSYQGRRFGVG